jgi:hypothetical protein
MIACPGLQMILSQCKCGVTYSIIIDRSVTLEPVDLLFGEKQSRDLCLVTRNAGKFKI